MDQLSYKPKFNLWAENLFRGIEVGDSATNKIDKVSRDERRVFVSSANISKAKDEITIQVDGGMACLNSTMHSIIVSNFYHLAIVVKGYQNTYIIAERKPTTLTIWQ